MKFWITTFRAVETSSGALKKYEGERIYAPNMEDAQKYCKLFRPWLKVEGQLVADITNDGTSDYESDETDPPLDL